MIRGDWLPRRLVPTLCMLPGPALRGGRRPERRDDGPAPAGETGTPAFSSACSRAAGEHGRASLYGDVPLLLQACRTLWALALVIGVAAPPVAGLGHADVVVRRHSSTEA